MRCGQWNLTGRVAVVSACVNPTQFENPEDLEWPLELQQAILPANNGHSLKSTFVEWKTLSALAAFLGW